jgi:hypothetical protein
LLLDDPAVEAKRQLAWREMERRKAKADPCYLMSFMIGVDQRDGEKFNLAHLREPLKPGEVELVGNTLRTRDRSWRWQRWVAEEILANRRTIILKGRQIGVTWIVLAVDVAEAVLMPDTASLLYRQREDEAIDNVRRWWTLYQSLPAYFKDGITAVKPERTERPGAGGVTLRHRDGRLSEIVPMTSAASSGHGRSVRRVILDEAAHIEKLAPIRAAVEPAAGRAAITNISTANGRSNAETGEGNEFHRLWTTPNSGYKRVFLPFDIHPDRGPEWYANAPEVQSLPMHLRQQNFPRDEHEAFALSDRLFFDPETLAKYREHVQNPLYRMEFAGQDGKMARRGAAKLRKHDEGLLRIYKEPRPETKYAIGCDIASGRGADYTVAYVIDLATMEFCAEFIGRLDADLFAGQAHYLGRWFGTQSGCPKDALIAVETSIGSGEAVLVSLRDGREGRPSYKNLYRHVMSSKPTLDTAKTFGFPSNSKTRPLILNQLEKATRDFALPWVTENLLYQMEEFVHHDSGTTPRARAGSHDDAVIAASIALEMYRLYGEHEHRPRKRAKKPLPAYPWQPQI